MREIYVQIREAANDAKLSDAAFRRVMREMFERRQHNETLLVSFLRAKDTVLSQMRH